MTYRTTLSAALFCSLALFATTSHARAETEFCPASVLETHTFDSGDSHIAAIRLVAASSRSEHGDIAIYSDGHMFIAPFSEVSFEEDVAHIQTDLNAFDRIQYIAPVVYVRTASALDTSATFWVSDGQTTGETEFGWDAKKRVLCTPPAGLGIVHPSSSTSTANAHERSNPLPPWELPDHSASVALAQEVPMPSATCDKPAADANVIIPQMPDGPDSVAQVPVEVAVEVALDNTGKVVDAWLTEPSRYQRLNDAVLSAAKSTTYTPGRALCTDVPGTYIFHTRFDPD